MNNAYVAHCLREAARARYLADYAVQRLDPNEDERRRQIGAAHSLLRQARAFRTGGLRVQRTGGLLVITPTGA